MNIAEAFVRFPSQSAIGEIKLASASRQILRIGYPLLRQVLRSTFVTHRQLYELLKLDYHTHSRNAFNNRVLRLVRNKYLVRDEIPYRTQGYVYSISDKGASELIGLGEYYTSPTCRPKDGQIPKAVFHAIELNEIHLALKRSEQLVRWMPTPRSVAEMS